MTKIENLSKQKEDENWTFRMFLKIYDGQYLDAIVHTLLKQVSEKIDCTACANCCKKIKPTLNEKEINKLSKRPIISADDFLAKYADTDEDGNQTLNQLPCPFLKHNKCTHYDSRPADCASYPHLHKEDIVFRLIGVIDNYSICPIVFNVYEALKSRLEHEFIAFKKIPGEYW